MAIAITTHADSANLTEAIATLRQTQANAYNQEDFPACFAADNHLAAADPAYAQSYIHQMQKTLHALAQTTPNLRFLQIGGMDGKRFDPIYAFTKHYRWSGIILEPLPDLFAALTANYANAPQVTLVNAALMDTDGTQQITRVTRAAAQSGAVPDWAEGLGSFHPNRNALGGVGVDADLHAALLQHTVRETVSCLTLRSVAKQCGLQRIDLLQVDAEGCELNILRQVISEGYTPRVIQLEHWALPEAERDAIHLILRQAGYRVRMSEADLLATESAWSQRIGGKAGWPTQESEAWKQPASQPKL